MLTISEMRGRARAFVNEWAGETREAAERQTFWNEWFEIFGIRRRRRVIFERNVRKLSGTLGQIDAFWPGMLLVEHKSAGENLDVAMVQAEAYLNGLTEEELPRLIVLSDFDRFRILNLETRDEVEFSLEALPDKLDLFIFLAGYRPRWFEEQDEVNVQAAELMGVLHDRLAETGYGGHELRVLLVRILFLLFADDTGLWGETGLFEDYIERRTSEDGMDLGMHLAALFEVLDRPGEERQTNLDESLQQFPYINGNLFSERVALAAFDKEMRDTLLRASHFNWSKISPAIFGSMFQSVMKQEARQAIGAHYTTERNILKVIEPLFLDGLRSRLDVAGTDRRALRTLFQDLRDLKFFDPACGCGNFLVIAYRELRRIELEVLRRLQALDRSVREGQLSADVSLLSHVDVDQFFGIEVEEFPARIAEVAMYLVDHLANQELSQEFGLSYARIPLHSPVNIHVGNALRLDWTTVLAPGECTYLFGNPPFVAKKRRNAEQVEDMEPIFGGRTVLDYVASWFVRAAEFAKSRDVQVAFVATNSIVQGEQVPALWPRLLDQGIVIDFAHRSFRWTSEASGKAAVYVVVIGFSYRGVRPTKVLYDYERATVDEPQERNVGQINPYLADAPQDVIPVPRENPLTPVPIARWGSMPNDGGHLLMSDAERDEVCAEDQIAARYIRPLLGAEQIMNGTTRWCLWLIEARPEDIRKSRILRDRVEQVKDYREQSSRPATRRLAETPAVFGEIRQPAEQYLCAPLHTSERRRFVPMVFAKSDAIAHNSTFTIENADLYSFGILQSSMWMAWVRAIGGRLKGDFRISAKLTYNTFPWPEKPNTGAEGRVKDCAAEVLAARKTHPSSSLAEMYDPLAMPLNLVNAHAALDSAVDRLYGRGSFDEVKRLALLLERYRKMMSKLPAGKD